MLVTVTGNPPQADDSRRGKAFMALARAASKLQIDCVVSTPSELQDSGKRFSGWVFQTGKQKPVWTRTQLHSEHLVVYDAMYLADLKRHKQAYRRLLWKLHALRVPVFNPILPAKDKVYRVLMRNPQNAFQLPKTFFDVTPSQVIRLLDEHALLWLKPTLGSGGRNMMRVTRTENGRYSVEADRFFGERIRKQMTQSEFSAFISRARQERTYMAQVHIPLLKTGDERLVDLRVTVQRDIDGAWHTTAVTGRCGAPNSSLTNYHAGGRITSLTDLNRQETHEWLRSVGMSESDVQRARAAAISAARKLQSVHPTLGMLGVDVGQTTSGEQYVYDCNGRPGRDILTDAEVRTYMNRVAGFAGFLINRKKNS